MVKVLWTPMSNTRMCIFPKLLPQSWKHRIEHNFLECRRIKNSLYSNERPQASEHKVSFMKTWTAKVAVKKLKQP